VSELPQGWAVASIADLTSKPDAVDWDRWPASTFTYIDISSIDSRSARVAAPKELERAAAPSRARQIVRSGDTLFSTVRTYLRNIGYVDDTFDGQIASTGFCVLRPAVGVHPRYVFYYSQSSSFIRDISGQQRGVSYPAVTDGQVRSMPIPIPPTEEQTRIVAAIEEQFSRLDAGLAALERVRQNLKRMRASILAHEFSSIAVTAPRVPGRDLFSFVTSGSRGWATYYSVEGSLFLRIGNIPRSGIDLDLHDLQRVQPPANAEGTRTQVHAGDVLISITADLGRVAVVPPTFETAYINQHVALARPKSGIEARYLAWYLASPKGLQQWDKLRRGATKIGLGLDDIRAIDVPMPSVEIQKVTADRIDRGWIAVQAAESEVSRAVHRMDALRSAVLSGAFSGKLVPQDPSDEPASVLLERIAIDRWSSHGHKLRKLSARQEALL
jgi:type I restriction enzyme, S subunit